MMQWTMSMNMHTISTINMNTRTSVELTYPQDISTRIVTITRQWSMLTHTFPMPTIGMFIEAPLIGCLGAW